MLEKFVIKGGKSLKGKVRISGAKNSALPLLAASILSENGLTLENVPDVADVRTMLKALELLGVKYNFKKENGIIDIDSSNVKPCEIPYDIIRRMRASVLLMGPLLARFKKAYVYTPGGCAIGARPIDLHIEAFKKLGADYKVKEGYSILKAKKLKGNFIYFDKVTVTGTENVIMASVFAAGETIIENAAIEPEVVDLCNCLLKMGAKIEGIGTKSLRIKGVESLKKINHTVIPDRIEAGTFVIAAAVTKGRVEIESVIPSHLDTFLSKVKDAGVNVEVKEDSLIVDGGSTINPVDIETSPYPGFPTDLQAQFMVLMLKAKGVSHIKENIFENRFQHVQELVRLGADIKLDGNTAIVKGGKPLTGADVMATDLRASASLVLAGLFAKGVTRVHRIYHLDRGYEKFEEKLIKLGASIKREKD
ncbi:UDP-N-acetylglucosamine 1-carboxyvinyltransferase [Thermotomaculum hydrothermale]|uniref:UDP-N-acetylglucosamine 1-carboxyvinyltransferase n=1 Tax=Thermotomaculum hydrothermale TaxID=981385 RepID=A0A7R6PPW2_9BACT|nr:UDP-N-acetylglucosamine 1-carboxyvinyltransferase [Thermotomaculum hydrothermale]BBB32186.1 UDP-N-acetylglucosamine 1-carboxyvinyltransferase [Thermotomaculum hydrothermale]